MMTSPVFIMLAVGLVQLVTSDPRSDKGHDSKYSYDQSANAQKLFHQNDLQNGRINFLSKMFVKYALDHDKNIIACGPFYCLNGGKCDEHGKCKCQKGYKGWACEDEDRYLDLVGKPAKQDSGSGASKAVDGNANGKNMKTCTHTADNNDAHWWYVDMGATYNIDAVTLTTRGDCCMDNLRKYYITVHKTEPKFDGSKPAQDAICTRVENYFFGSKKFKCDKVTTGRYLAIQKDANTYTLTLCEVKVDLA